MTDSPRRSGLLDWLLPSLAAGLLWLVALTLRVSTAGRENVELSLAAGRGVILASWHNRLLTGLYSMRRYRPLVMVSRSRDGERIARIAQLFGYRPIRGSSSRGGARALLRLVRDLRGGVVCAHLVDGPRGPVGEVKPGLILAAQRSGAVIVPAYVQALSSWRVRSWDRMEIPRPFSRVRVRFGPPRDVPRNLSAEAAETLRKEVEAELAQGYAGLSAELSGAAEPAGRR